MNDNTNHFKQKLMNFLVNTNYLDIPLSITVDLIKKS